MNCKITNLKVVSKDLGHSVREVDEEIHSPQDIKDISESFSIKNKFEGYYLKHKDVDPSLLLKMQKMFVDTKDLNNETFVKKVYPLLLQKFGLQNIAPKNLKIVGTKEFPSGYFDEFTGDLLFNKEYINSASKKDIIRTLSHEITHLKQYATIYKMYGRDEFKNILSNNMSIMKNYSEKNNFNSYADYEKMMESIGKDINESPVYNRVDKNFFVKDKKSAGEYKDACINYVDADSDYQAYRKNILEDEAFSSGDDMSQLYEDVISSSKNK